MSTPDIMTNPLAKLNAVRFNESFDRNQQDALYHIILSVDNTTNIGFISYTSFQKRAKMSRPTVSKALKELVSKEIITVLGEGNNLKGVASRYQLHPNKLLETFTWSN